jgi:hypothetical protein
LKPDSPEVQAARNLAIEAAGRLSQSAAFRRLGSATQAAILRDLGTIRTALSPASPPVAKDPFAFALETPNDLRRRLFAGRGTEEQPAAAAPVDGGQARQPRKAATETLAQRAGALIDEIDFPGFVAGLINGTFDAMVDASIRQMEAFADLVGSVAKNAEDFTRDNVSANQARDWLAEHYPRDLVLDAVSLDTGQPTLRVRQRTGEDQEPPSPEWLADFNFAGAELTDELVEQELVPAARRRVGESRLQTLATMVLLGMNRIVVRDGSISARVRFRAAAADKASVDYAVSQDPGSGDAWGQRGSSIYPSHTTMVSTVGVNAQTDQSLKAELFGEVKINFASETLPLERFADEARVALLQRHARPAPVPAAAAAVPPVDAGTTPATPAPPTPEPQPAAPAPGGT